MKFTGQFFSPGALMGSHTPINNYCLWDFIQVYKSRALVALSGLSWAIGWVAKPNWVLPVCIGWKKLLGNLPWCLCPTALQIWVFPHCSAGKGSGLLLESGKGWDGQRWSESEQFLAYKPQMLACSSSRAVKLGYELQSKLRLKLLLWRAERVMSIYCRLRIICLPLFPGAFLRWQG